MRIGTVKAKFIPRILVSGMVPGMEEMPSNYLLSG